MDRKLAELALYAKEICPEAQVEASTVPSSTFHDPLHLEKGGKRYLTWQIWDFEEEQYALPMYFIEEGKKSGAVKTYVMRSRYYAISPNHLLPI